jgi:hypothetical protein
VFTTQRFYFLTIQCRELRIYQSVDWLCRAKASILSLQNLAKTSVVSVVQRAIQKRIKGLSGIN